MVPAHRFHVPHSVLSQTLHILNCYNNSIKKLPFLFSSLWRNQGSERLSNLAKFTQFMCGKNEYMKIMWIIYVINSFVKAAGLRLVAQSCLTLCDPMDCSPTGSSVHGDSPGKSTGVGCHALLQGIFPTRGLNPDLSHCRWILYQLSYQGSPGMLAWAAYPFFRGSSRPRSQTRVSFIVGRFFTSWATRENSKGYYVLLLNRDCRRTRIKMSWRGMSEFRGVIFKNYVLKQTYPIDLFYITLHVTCQEDCQWRRS